MTYNVFGGTFNPTLPIYGLYSAIQMLDYYDYYCVICPRVT